MSIFDGWLRWMNAGLACGKSKFVSQGVQWAPSSVGPWSLGQTLHATAYLCGHKGGPSLGPPMQVTSLDYTGAQKFSAKPPVWLSKTWIAVATLKGVCCKVNNNNMENFTFLFCQKHFLFISKNLIHKMYFLKTINLISVKHWILYSAQGMLLVRMTDVSSLGVSIGTTMTDCWHPVWWLSSTMRAGPPSWELSTASSRGLPDSTWLRLLWLMTSATKVGWLFCLLVLLMNGTEIPFEVIKNVNE